MRSVPRFIAWFVFAGLLLATSYVWAVQEPSSPSDQLDSTTAIADQANRECDSAVTKPNRVQVLIASMTVFSLAVIVGFEIIAKVPPTLHTPLMSGSNAISGITVVGALIAAGNHQGGFASFLGLLAVILANINVVGGFWVTHRMLLMFKKK